MPLLAVTRYVVPDAEAAGFPALGAAALDALTGQPGCRRGYLARCADDETRWLMHTEWDGVGAYRRALSAYDVKLRAVPVMYLAVDEPSAYEVLVEVGPHGVVQHGSDRAAGADAASPGRVGDR